MVCVLHVVTGTNTGIIVPYNVGDYHSWKEHEADLLMNRSTKTQLVGTEKCYHVKWVNSKKMGSTQIVSEEEFERDYSKNCERIEGAPVRFSVNRGGGFSVAGKAIGHLDRVARPLWTDQDKRTR